MTRATDSIKMDQENKLQPIGGSHICIPSGCVK